MGHQYRPEEQSCVVVAERVKQMEGGRGGGGLRGRNEEKKHSNQVSIL